MLVGVAILPTFDLLTTLRQSVFYLLVIASPVVGLDAGRDLTPRIVVNSIGFIGTISAIGFAADWLQRRNISSVEVGRFMLSSLVVPALAFSLALVCVTYTRKFKRLLWLISIVIVPAAMIVTGTRTNLIIFVGILGVAGARKFMRVPLRKLLIAMTVAFAVMLSLIPLLASNLLRDPEFLDSRFRSILTIIGGNPESDESFRLRADQYQYAWDHIKMSPYFGFGPGFTADIPMDTPLITVVKYGFIGTSVLMIFVFSASRAAKHLARIYGYHEIHSAIRGFELIFLALIPFGTPFEDRGFGFTLMLVFMGLSSVAEYRIKMSQGRLASRRQETQPLASTAHSIIPRRSEESSAARSSQLRNNSNDLPRR
ncbi:O-antigen ligase family protein [Arthrobacter sp. A2-55]|uniref:O-antigen ligase family protein n=1 Tax=Arthrobacter sp. A2-55 TaxID=2897337 RepID=UPI0021CD6C24|nr:O-antigen ligase family protein [Arthrobacter sp. A2-55]MCU6479915.1 O-antigen ligase family protein [Arthrobacter sp. A2-55]